MTPLLDLKSLNAPMQADIDAAILRVARSGRYILGPEVEAFEHEWAAYCGVDHCVGTGNCLDALRLILMAYDIGPGDEVIVPANTYIATWLAVSLVGATPVPVDADARTRNIDPALIPEAITKRTRAILATHLYGLPAPMDALRQIASRRGLLLFADAAQAHGSMVDGEPIGGTCHAEAFSFYPSKNLGALGDGGCVTTNDAHIAAKIRRLRNYGGVGRLDHSIRGINSRLDEMQAAVLRAKLPYLDEMNERRLDRACIYARALRGLATLPPSGSGDAQGNYHQYVIESKDRNGLQKRLAARGIDAHVHYPVPPHMEPAYADLGIPRGSFPVAERLANEVLSLPIGNDVDAAEIARVVAEECEPVTERDTSRDMEMANA